MVPVYTASIQFRTRPQWSSTVPRGRIRSYCAGVSAKETRAADSEPPQQIRQVPAPYRIMQWQPGQKLVLLFHLKSSEAYIYSCLAVETVLD